VDEEKNGKKSEEREGEGKMEGVKEKKVVDTNKGMNANDNN
jgi:hypothetical protein